MNHRPTTSDPAPAARRGVTMLAFVGAMLVIGAMALWLAQITAVSGLGYLGHYLSSGAFYASESANDLAMRELKANADVDGNSVIGTISNAPALPNGTMVTTVSGKVYTSTGTWQNHVRVTETTLQ